MAKMKFPKKLIAFHSTAFDDEPVLLCAETPEEISEDFADQAVGVYELVTTGKFNVEKSVSGKPVKKLIKR